MSDGVKTQERELEEINKEKYKVQQKEKGKEQKSIGDTKLDTIYKQN